MSIIRVAARNQYLVMDHATAADLSISWEAKGLHTYLLSRPDNWKVNPEQLAKAGTAGRDKIYRMLRELILHRYAVRNEFRDEATGRIVDYEYVIYESPVTGKTVTVGGVKINVDSPRPEKPEAAPLTENTEAVKASEDSTEKPLTENQEPGPLPDLPDTDLPDTANQESKRLTNTDKNLELNSPSEVGLNIPRASSDATLPAGKRSNGTFPMSIDWRPGDQFGELLKLAGLGGYEWDDDLPEFILYRLGQSDVMSQGSWEHRFFKTIKHNVEMRKLAGNKPTQIPVDWEPPRDVASALLLRGMTRKFLEEQLLEFVSFWRDAGNFAQSWTAKFIQHVNAQWARYVPPQKSTFENLTDRSWAAGMVPGLDDDALKNQNLEEPECE